MASRTALRHPGRPCPRRPRRRRRAPGQAGRGSRAATGCRCCPWSTGSRAEGGRRSGRAWPQRRGADGYRVAMSGPRDFDPAVVGNRETDAWAAYYRREWRTFLRSAVGMVGAGFGMGRADTLRGAWYVLRANQRWAPYPDNDPDGAREQMRRFYALVVKATGELVIDPVRASEL